MKNHKIYNILFWFWFFTVILLSVVPKTPKSQIKAWGLEFRIDYFEHLVVYFLLGTIFIIKKKSDNKLKNLNRILFYVLWIGFAVITETVQIGIAGRSFNPNDMYYNVLGILLGLAATDFFFTRIKNERAEATLKN